jgi:hypothetical protein
VINEKQKNLFETLKMIKDQWVDISLIKLEDGIEKVDLKEQQNDIIESVLYSVMEMIDGYNGNLTYSLDLIDKEKGQSLIEGIELHDQFMNYLYEVEKERY